MIPYNQEDQKQYYAERSFFITSFLGMEPQLITSDNYENIRQAIYLLHTGPTVIRLITELGNIIFFSTTVGFDS